MYVTDLNKFRFLLTWGLCMFTLALTAQDEVFVNQLQGEEVKLNAVLLVEDDLYLRNPEKESGVGETNAHNRIVWKLSADGSTSDTLAAGKYQLLVKVEYWTSNDRPGALASEGFLRELEVDVVNGRRIGMTSYEFSGGRRLTVTPQTLRHDGLPVAMGDFEQSLSAEISVARPRLAKSLTCDAQREVGSIRFAGVVNHNTLTVQLDPTEAADEYDLEYAYFELESPEYSVLVRKAAESTAMVDDLLRHNATRITAKSTIIRIHNLYDRGVLLFRYRAVDAANANNRRYTPWSSAGKRVKDYVGAAAKNSVVITTTQAINRQAQNNFAEDAKQLPAITFLDGTMRPRQQLTLHHLENRDPLSYISRYTIGQRSIYDALGRPAATTLPTPLYSQDHNFSSLRNGLFNPATMERTEGGKPYDQAAIERLEGCLPPAMSAAAGAGKFYSDANAQMKRNVYVPHGEGYPFSVTRFTPDNTGRVLRSGGVGPTLQAGGDHDTRYYYSQPTQAELDQLFGINAGYAEHYEKNMVVDPNGQVSVSILDAKGRTVATALAGGAAQGTSALKSATDATERVKVNMLNNYRSGAEQVSTYSMTVEQNTPIELCYALGNATYSPYCCSESTLPDCFDCYYDVEVTISSLDPYVCTEGSEVYTALPYKKTFFGKKVGSIGDCFNGSGSFAENLRLPIGAYQITKRLKVNEEKLTEATEAYLAEAACVKSEEAFVADYMSQVSTASCDETCDCETVQASDVGCWEACSIPDPCEVLREQLYNDLRPEGLYARIPGSPSVELPEGVAPDPTANSTRLSYFRFPNRFGEPKLYQRLTYGNQTVVIGGVVKAPNELTQQEFVDNFSEEWLPFLLPAHPEACLLDFCDQRLRGSSQADSELRKVNEIAVAERLRIVPAATSASYTHDNPSSRTYIRNIVRQDEFFRGRSNLQDEFLNQIANSSDRSRNIMFTVKLTMDRQFGGEWRFRPRTTRANERYQNSYAWRILRDQYLNRKSLFVAGKQRAYCGGAGSDVSVHGTNLFCLDQQICRGVPCRDVSRSCAETYTKYPARWVDVSRMQSDRSSIEDFTLQFGGDAIDSDEITSINTKPLELSADLFIAWLSGQPTDLVYANLRRLGGCCNNASLTASALANDSIRFKEGEVNLVSSLQEEFKVPQPRHPQVNEIDPCYIERTAYFSNIPKEEIEWLVDALYSYVTNRELYLRNYTPPDFTVRIPLEVLGDQNKCKSVFELQSIWREWAEDNNYRTSGPIPIAFANYINESLQWSRPLIHYQDLLTNGSINRICKICADAPAESLEYNPQQSCRDAILDKAENQALLAYDSYLEDKEASFRLAYQRRCFDGSREKFFHTREVAQYHYTLYYYDQAGNLTMTVPPEGAKVTGDLGAARLSQARSQIEGTGSASGRPILPAHELFTHYRYNTFNEVIGSDSPDKDEAQSWYDELGRVVLSQDGRQRSLSPARYSYTRYDALGRVTAVGEFPNKENEPVIKLVRLASQLDGLEKYWRENQISQLAVTRTYYSDNPFANRPLPLETSSLTLRNRVAASTFSTSVGYRQGRSDYDYATHYGYDISGNVEKLVQELTDLRDIGHQYKTIEYDYDLISGNVHGLIFQRGQEDQFTYRYEYDQSNRLVAAYSSASETRHPNSLRWRRDVAYQYYDHGPLKRTLIGQGALQGVDYAYTLQGWIKGVNGGRGHRRGAPDLPVLWDMNSDGYSPSRYARNPLKMRDLYRYQNNYFVQDYRPIGIKDVTEQPFYPMEGASKELFNGNISSHNKIHAADDFANSRLFLRYDQLNRLVLAKDYTRTGAEFASENNIIPSYRYDANGNLEALQRFVKDYVGGQARKSSNKLTYNYEPGTNRLASVTATGGRPRPSAPFPFIARDQNYTYDPSGNLIQQRDGAASTSSISWNPYGKVQQINHSGEAAGAGPKKVEFGYGPDQNRWSKRLYGDLPDGEDGYTMKQEWLVRDAQGNTLATYEREATAVPIEFPTTDPDPPGGPDIPPVPDFPDIPDVPPGPVFDPPFTVGSVGPEDEYAIKFGPLIWREQNLYGSARLGRARANRPLAARCDGCPSGLPPQGGAAPSDEEQPEVGDGADYTIDYALVPPQANTLLPREYELTNHLGNVMAVFGEEVEEVTTRFGETYSRPRLLAHNDYLPFGVRYSRLAGEVEGVGYRYGFNGKEKDTQGEWGDLTHYNFDARIFNPAIGRFFAVDPLDHELSGFTSYGFAFNNPIVYKDPSGEIPILPFLLKAGAAGAADMLTQAAMLYLFDPKVESASQAFEKVNWWQVARSSGEGLIPWKVPGGKFSKAGATASGDVLVNAINQGSNYTTDQAILDFSGGFIGSLAGDGFGELLVKYGVPNVRRGLSKAGFGLDRINKMTGSFGSMLSKKGRYGLSGKQIRDQFEPGSSTGFTGVFDTRNGDFTIAPSGLTDVSRSSFDNPLPRNGGHRDLSRALQGSTADGRSNITGMAGFSLEYVNENTLNIKFISGLNGDNGFGTAASSRVLNSSLQNQVLSAIKEAYPDFNIVKPE